MNHWTVKKQLLFLIFTMLIVQIAIGWVGYSSLTSVNSHLSTVFQKRLPSINYLLQADRDYQQMLVAERTLLLDGLTEEQEKSFLKDYNTNKEQVIARFKKYRELGLSEEEQSLSTEFDQNLTAWNKESQENFIFKNNQLNNPIDKTIGISKSLNLINKKFEDSRNRLDSLQELILGYANNEYTDANDRYQSSKVLILVMTIFGIFSSLTIGFLIVKRLTKRISTNIESTSEQGLILGNVSDTLAEKSQALSQVSHELSAAVTETTSSLHEISLMIKNNTEGSEKVAGLVSKSKDLVDDGVTYLKDLNIGIKGVEESAEELAKTVQSSNEELTEIIRVFEEVNNKTKIINDIVFQTKLLSFNASVEAARAGENGKGFSVVAEEIGVLAKMSGNSADEISKLLSESLKKVTEIVENSNQTINTSVSSSKKKINSSVQLSSECQDIFSKVLNNFDLISTNSAEVASASQEQLAGVQEVNKAMQEISSSASLTSYSAEDVNEASAKLSNSVVHISDTIKDLKTLIDNKRTLIHSTDEKIENKDIETFSDNTYDNKAA